MPQFHTTFSSERAFEDAVIERLIAYGWEENVLEYQSEEQLLQNWADILFENNRDIDRLGDFPLTESEKRQLVEQINFLRTPVKLNSLINGKSITIIRDHPEDTEHFGKEVSLKIYDRQEIAAGQSRYQIVRQPLFPTINPLASDRRGDLLLLINGMPLIHIELKKTGIPVSQASNQIEKYAREGIFTSGLFAMIQLFVAMNPSETIYFANPGPEGKFNKDYFFHWADFNNESINEWYRVCETLLSIPMAHQLIGFYTVADSNDGCLKVMRSYQYYAANAISQKVQRTHWDDVDNHGGYIWHTTGSGKTLTSFKSAQLIAQSRDADKVVFLVDRIELGTQSFREYQGFAEDGETVNDTAYTSSLINKLKSSDQDEVLIVTSIQKMSNIKEEEVQYRHAIETIRRKRLVFIIDECHRSTFGDMLLTIKQTFPKAIFFGFTGTPIHDENQRMHNTTATVFGDELHRYSIADGIRDKNVLGFDPVKCMTYQDRDLRRVVALEKAQADSEEEVWEDSQKERIFTKYMHEVPMAGRINDDSRYEKGIEDYIPKSQYETDKYRLTVVNDIGLNWRILSHGGKFHSIFATSSIAEAIEYYRLFKDYYPELKVATLYDNSIDNEGDTSIDKEEATIEMLQDYNDRYGMTFTMAKYPRYKKDVAARLAHKSPYVGVENVPEKQLDILIVVDQMLTGYDSKWVNTLYMDKVMRYEGIIQAFSRTNRLFGPDKPFGSIRYYRYPHTMEKHIEEAFRLYSGDRPYGLFADKLETNLSGMNAKFMEIKDLFEASGVANFERLPESVEERGMFAKLFKQFNDYYEAARIQGFMWNKEEYSFNHNDGTCINVKAALSETTYRILALRYKELFSRDRDDTTVEYDLPYDIDTYLTEINTDRIDSDYMQSRFEKYLRVLNSHTDEKDLYEALGELHRSFASLSQEEQRFAYQILSDVQSGNLLLSPGRTLREYLNEYIERFKNDRIHLLAVNLGANEAMLRDLVNANPTAANLNEFGRFDALIDTIDKEKALVFIEQWKGEAIARRRLNSEIYTLMRRLIIGNADSLFSTASHILGSTTIAGSINIGTNIEYADTVIVNSNSQE